MDSKFAGRWAWCSLCRTSAIYCERCGNTSCNGGGCEDGHCYDDFEEVIWMDPSKRPTKDDLDQVEGLEYEPSR